MGAERMTFKSSAVRLVRRTMRSPYADAQRTLIVHCSHHKAGSVWFNRVLRVVARTYGIRAFLGEQRDLPRDAELFVQNHGRIDRATLPAFRGSHLIRDPRDVVVSGYFYHCKTTETWAHIPNERYGGRSYQDHLLSLDKDAGLLAEIERCATSDMREMVNWNYQDDRFLEMRYEALIADERTGFRRLFEHYGFKPVAVNRCIDIALSFNIERARATTKHVRSGVPGEWRNHFGASHKEAFKRLFGDAALRLGYETNSDW